MNENNKEEIFDEIKGNEIFSFNLWLSLCLLYSKRILNLKK